MIKEEDELREVGVVGTHEAVIAPSERCPVAFRASKQLLCQLAMGEDEFHATEVKFLTPFMLVSQIQKCKLKTYE